MLKDIFQAFIFSVIKVYILFYKG